jgi:hypothetical protein
MPQYNIPMIGTRPDKHLLAGKLLEALPNILATAIPDFLARLDFYRWDSVALAYKHVLTGATLEDDIANLRQTSPHFFADWSPEKSDEEILQDIIREAVLNPTPASLGALYNKVGKLRYDTILAQHGVDPTPRGRDGKMTPGKMEADDSADSGKRKDHPSKNPWSAAAWNISGQGAIVRSRGLERAAAMAAKVGCVIGSVRPNPRFN